MDFVDLFGYEMEGNFLLFADDFAEIPAVYVVYTEKQFLDVYSTDNLKESIENNTNTSSWLKQANGEDVYIAFTKEEDPIKREDIFKFLISKAKPVYLTL